GNIGHAGEGRRQRVDFGTPGDARESAKHGTETDRQHDDRKLRLADHAAQDGHIEDGAKSRDHHDRDQEADPIVDTPRDHRHVGDECAKHQQVALGKIDQLGCFIDQHEPERDQAVDAADRKPVQGQLQESSQFPSPSFWRLACHTYVHIGTGFGPEIFRAAKGCTDPAGINDLLRLLFDYAEVAKSTPSPAEHCGCGPAWRSAPSAVEFIWSIEPKLSCPARMTSSPISLAARPTRSLLTAAVVPRRWVAS